MDGFCAPCCRSVKREVIFYIDIPKEGSPDDALRDLQITFYKTLDSYMGLSNFAHADWLATSLKVQPEKYDREDHTQARPSHHISRVCLLPC